MGIIQPIQPVSNPYNFELVKACPDGELRTDTLTIAAGTENDHASVIKLVRTYQADLEDFGEVGFEIRHNPQGSPTEFALLNEPQTTLLFTFMRNSEIVRGFKKALVRAFFELRQPQAPKTHLQATMTLVQELMAQEQRLATLETKVAEQEAKAAEQEAKAAEALLELTAFQVPEVAVRELTDRFAVNRVVRSYCTAQGVLPRNAWNHLYLEFRDRYHIDLKARARKADFKGSVLEFAETLGEKVMEDLYALACHLFAEVA